MPMDPKPEKRPSALIYLAAALLILGLILGFTLLVIVHGGVHIF
jgi:hypothetical protein